MEVTKSKINEVFGITESYMLPDKMMQTLLQKENRGKIFEIFSNEDLTKDLFTNYFQEEHSNRKQMMQDFTPSELAEVLINDENWGKCLDLCAGTGGLTIKAWAKKRNAYFVTEELSERAFPILLFNMAIRNMQGLCINKNVLSGEFKKGFKLEKGEKYSNIIEIFEEPEEVDFDIVITNPPYSLRYEWDENKKDSRFDGYCYPPTKSADYAFIMHGISKMKSGGTLSAILPHGVLFRVGKEEVIRKKLIENKLINTVIGLPKKLFLNTQIPVCIIVIKSESPNIFFIDSSKNFEKGVKQNKLREQDVQKIKEERINRTSTQKYSRVVDYSEIEKNDYNLNIPRYVDTFEEKQLPDMDVLLNEMKEIDKDISKAEKELLNMINQLVCSDEKGKKIIEKHKRILRRKQNEQLTLFDYINVD